MRTRRRAGAPLQRLGNDAFTGIFIAEVVLKNVALTPNIYWQDYWNRFDFVIIIASIAAVVITQFSDIKILAQIA